MELYVSLSAYGGVTTREALTVFWEALIRHVELAIGPKPEPDAAQAIWDFHQQGICYRAHHAFVWGDAHKPFNLARHFDAEYFARLIDWLASLGVTAYSVHAGSYPRDSAPGVAYTRFLENIHQLNDLCQQREITLGVETMYTLPPHSQNQNLLDNAAMVAQFCIDAPEVKLVIDLAHLNIWHHDGLEEKLQLLETPPERILEIHVSDNDGFRDIHSLITPETWWIPAVEQLPMGVPVVLESRMNHLPARRVRQECDHVRALLAGTPQATSACVAQQRLK